MMEQKQSWSTNHCYESSECCARRGN